MGWTIILVGISAALLLAVIALLIKNQKATERQVLFERDSSEQDRKQDQLLSQIELLHRASNTLKQEKEKLAKQVGLLSIQLENSKASLQKLEEENNRLHEEKDVHEQNLKRILADKSSSMPWLAGMISDFLTYDIEVEAKKLEWGSNIQREKKVTSIRLIRAEAQRRIEEAKEAVYQLEYLRNIFPGLNDVLLADYKELRLDGVIPDHDPTLDYLSSEEWKQLPTSAKNQLALDRYVESRRKSNWEIGRDYELSVAYEYYKRGCHVDTYGSFMGLEDLGRDLIVKSQGKVFIIQCKYWSKSKTIHEKHIYQLYGTTVGYCIENGLDHDRVIPVFYTNTKLSSTARKVADYLAITYYEDHDMVEFPRIKCNIGRDEFGYSTKIYHLPMDDQYDKVKIEKQGEFYAFTVKEAESAGFRRAFKWHGEGN